MSTVPDSRATFQVRKHLNSLQGCSLKFPRSIVEPMRVSTSGLTAIWTNSVLKYRVGRWPKSKLWDRLRPDLHISFWICSKGKPFFLVFHSVQFLRIYLESNLFYPFSSSTGRNLTWPIFCQLIVISHMHCFKQNKLSPLCEPRSRMKKRGRAIFVFTLSADPLQLCYGPRPLLEPENLGLLCACAHC